MYNPAFKKTFIKVIGIAGLAIFSSSLLAASFDCAKAATPIEKMICESPPVSNLDEQLTADYKVALEKATDKDTLKQQQRAWLKEKRNACKDATCLFTVYQQRLVELSNTSVNLGNNSQDLNGSATTKKPSSNAIVIPENKRIENQKLPLTFKLVEGDSYPICQPYVDMLNKTKYMEYPSCERKLLPEYKQFKALQWVEVTDMKEKLRAVEDGITMEYASFLGLNDPRFKGTLKRYLKSTSENNTPMYKTIVDIDGDGNKETIYNRLNISSYAGSTNGCKIENHYYVVDSTINLDNAKQYFKKRYQLINLTGNNQVFLINNSVYQTLLSHSFIHKASLI